ncbi:regulator of G-protein signaling 14-like [Aplochiton taeniatus]
MSAVRASGGSSSSLPCCQDGETGQAKGVLGWAVCFEKLLEDPTGVRYFTDFLKSEVSDENILFWQACEKYQKIPCSSLKELKEAARAIYQTYLSDSAPYSVNIDDTARTEEKALQHPTPDMFGKAQTQIFKLMKMDSYRRFVRSPLYQSCSLACMEGRPLPNIPTLPACIGSWENMAGSSPSLNDSKKSKTQNKDPDRSPGGRGVRETQWDKRGSWGEPPMSGKSTSSGELGSIYRHTENSVFSQWLSDGSVSGSRVAVEGGYCCVYLPDGSASLAPTRPGTTLRDMLTGLCEKRGFPLKDVIIYLHGRDRQPLCLDQDCSVVRDQQVALELRVTFALVVFSGKPMGIKVKSSKTLQDALSLVLQKHQLKPQDVLVTMSGSEEPLSMSTSVFGLANKTILLDKVKGKEQTSSSKLVGHNSVIQGRGAPDAAAPEGPPSLLSDRDKAQPKPSKSQEMEGFLDMLSRAQCSRVDDQRGLLTKEHLELPLFLQLPSAMDHGPSMGAEPGSEAPVTSSTSSASSAPTETKNHATNHSKSTSSLCGGAKGPKDSPLSKPKDSSHTTL